MSPRKSIWIMVKNSAMLEGILLKCLKKLPEGSERREILTGLIQESLRARYTEVDIKMLLQDMY